MSPSLRDGGAERLRHSVEWRGEWRDGVLEVIDQTLLPDRLEIRRLNTADDVIDAVVRLVVRGAPAIGVTAAFGVVIGLREGQDIDELSARFIASRPTAVNLGWAVRRVAAAARAAEAPQRAERALEEAKLIQAEDRQACLRIGEFGRRELSGVERVMTHCNTGRLATSGMGTALGVVYAKAEAGEPIEVVATETRPLLQGARLTAWELADAGIPVTLIADAAAGAALHGGRVQAVIVGCDRVARNGDTANKVGTYNLAVLARVNKIPFYVAGPMTSFDPDTPDGVSIEIELRRHEELRTFAGTSTAPEVEVWNPAFDVTPADLITAFVTDVGVLRPPYDASISEAMVPRR